MGLKCDKNGVKAQLKSRFPQAFREFPTLVEARDASQAARDETVSAIDGNVLMLSIPQSATTLDAYVLILTTILKKALATCSVTVVVFDEPAVLTEAKKQEQMRRDASRRSSAVVCSSDMTSSAPTDDNYTTADMERVPDVHTLVGHRGSRLRFFDEVSGRVLANLKAQIDRWNKSGFPGGSVLFDGIDPRGGDRPLGHARAPQMVGSDEALAALFAREVPIGEGDLKLADIGRRARALALEGQVGLEKLKLSLVSTIDTDSFAVESLEVAKRAMADEATSKQAVNTLLCMRERARKRGKEDDKDAVFLCVDVTLLQALLQAHMWGKYRSPTPADRHAALSLMTAGWAMAGCDFVELKGLRADIVFESMPVVAKTIPDVIETMKLVLTGKRHDALLLEKPLRALAMTCASTMSETARVKRALVPAVRDPDEMVVKRAAWCACYWNSVEFRGELDDFGFFLPTSSDFDFA